MSNEMTAAECVQWLRARQNDHRGLPLTADRYKQAATYIESLQSRLEEALQGKEAWFHDSQVARRELEDRQSRLDAQQGYIASLKANELNAFEQLNAVEKRLSAGLDILTRWKATADPRANDWSNLAEDALIALRGGVVERQ